MIEGENLRLGGYMNVGQPASPNESRSTVVKLLDEGEITFEKAGTHHRVLLADLLEYRERRRERQYDMLAATRAAVDEENVTQALEDLKAARKAVAARRSARAFAPPMTTTSRSHRHPSSKCERRDRD